MNIVFDLCGVVFDWKPEAILDYASIAPAFHAQVKAGLFRHSDWLKLDRGTLSRHEAIRRAAAHTGLSTSTVADLIPYIPHALVMVSVMVDLLSHLKARGHRLFYLSNMNLDCIEHIERTHLFWGVFEGGIVSCRVHYLKPEPEIYTSLLQTYSLDGAETVFIDDRQINLECAKQFGIRTIYFESPEQCEAQLKALLLFPDVTY